MAGIKQLLSYNLILLALMFSCQGCLEKCENGNGGGYAGAMCADVTAPNSVASDVLGEGNPIAFIKYKKSGDCPEFDSTKPASEIVISGDQVTYKSLQCEISSQNLSTTELTFFTYNTNHIVYSGMVFHQPEYQNNQQVIKYSRALCDRKLDSQSELFGVNYIIEEKSSQLEMKIVGRMGPTDYLNQNFMNVIETLGGRFLTYAAEALTLKIDLNSDLGTNAHAGELVNSAEPLSCIVE